MHAGTIVSRHYLAHARTLARSFLRHNPDARFTALVVGEGAPIGDEPFEVLSEHDLGLTDIEDRRKRYDDFEYAVSFKPSLLRRLLEGDEHVVYLDADMYVVGSFDGLPPLLEDDGVLLTPHLTRSLPDDGLDPDMPDILRAGTFNTGFVAARRGPVADAFVAWWFDRLRKDCKVSPRKGVFVDQKWVDLAPAIIPGVGILRDNGWNLGHWNLPGQAVERRGDAWTVGGGPLRVFHFSGFDASVPTRLSKHQNRVDIEPGSDLAALAEEYAGAMHDNGYAEVKGGGKNTYSGRRLHQRLGPVRRVVADLRRRRHA